MKISDFDNPIEFQNFCSILFHAVHEDFESFDDAGGDLGIDGYVPNKSIFAYYCPDRDKLKKEFYKKKIRGDLKKAGEIEHRGSPRWGYWVLK